MANVLTVPNSGIISFDSRAYSNLTVPPLSTSARIIYDGGGGINITSYTTATTALDRFSVDGTQGRLFSVTDALTGKLFSVNNITGLPILEVLDSDTVIAGQFNTNAFVLSGTRLGLGTTPIGTNRLSVSGNSTFVGSISAHNTAKAWVNFDGTTLPPTIRNPTFNVSSVSRSTAGTYQVTFIDPMPNSNYCAVATSGNLNAVTNGESTATSVKTTTSVAVYTANAAAGTALDREDISLVVFSR
jgi:hypothetical protein